MEIMCLKSNLQNNNEYVYFLLILLKYSIIQNEDILINKNINFIDILKQNVVEFFTNIHVRNTKQYL